MALYRKRKNVWKFGFDKFVQVLHVHDHWICISNYNPWFDQNTIWDYWWVYDSLNQPLKYLPYLKPLMRKLNDQTDVIVMYPTVVAQQGIF